MHGTFHAQPDELPLSSSAVDLALLEAVDAMQASATEI
jgi:hypothetical protein